MFRAALFILCSTSLLLGPSAYAAGSEALAATAATAAATTVATTVGAEGFDWSILLSLACGVGGLIWIRRHIAQL